MRKLLTLILILCTVALFAEMRGGALYDPGAARSNLSNVDATAGLAALGGASLNGSSTVDFAANRLSAGEYSINTIDISALSIAGGASISVTLNSPNTATKALCFDVVYAKTDNLANQSVSTTKFVGLLNANGSLSAVASVTSTLGAIFGDSTVEWLPGSSGGEIVIRLGSSAGDHYPRALAVIIYNDKWGFGY